ncbi:uncharacterized protein LOC115782027 [Archocentrus centrarchus]|uniref:uncharacterized protein LOC115782027 n=1 Tax=Archocentrus centrarchus TaxID=63155 RepID=UPI0011EA09CF|nr:uncharacterized protein LOC115782027 [Archocentrus centrarchus]
MFSGAGLYQKYLNAACALGGLFEVASAAAAECFFGGRMMFDFEEADFFFEAEKRKRKKHKKHKTSMTVKTQESIQKKKKNKNFKFRDAMKERKQKKKEKEKRRLPLEFDVSLLFEERNSAQETFFENLEASYPPDPLTPDSRKKSKRKNKVVFDVPPCHIRIKRPKFASSSIEEKESVRDAESCSQVAVTGSSPDHGSQCTSDDINSQDLFITQKTFRKPLPDPSRGEASYRPLVASPELQTQQGNSQHPPLVKRFHEEADKWPQGSQPHQLCVQSNPEEAEENKALHKLQRKKTKSFLTQNTNVCEEKSVARPVSLKHRVGNPFLDEPVVVKSSLEVAEQNTCPPNQQSPSSLPRIDESLLPPRPTVSSSTQTENFFTTELSSYLSFCQKSRPTVCFEDLKPLDLSLPQKARKDLRSSLSELEVKNEGEAGGKAPSDSSHVKEKRLPSGRGETTPSPQFSESDQKSADTTTSSEDSEQPCRMGKLDLIQVRAVQMRLNESFFFKNKGERPSPRPESPLMKLAQGRDVKSRKSCSSHI